jgi:hypothetical protein
LSPVRTGPLASIHIGRGVWGLEKGLPELSLQYAV